ncbi:TIR domain protein [Leptospira interrogans serovar Grippotyphosa str. LT2186]|uniref:TIR domain protein n=1 Tax=Leptospira interrogans serovar Grippotyphosa str. LT2186 TaxID=1001599 RepID=M3I920_LEPIR|nr:TIR domain protein [Leptospira interrogans serovar Grippotyphosa str. LT2186]
MNSSKVTSLFICYSYDQIDWVRKIGTQIHSIFGGEIEAWWDEKKSAGDYWDSTINHRLSEAEAFLVILSPSFLYRIIFKM